MLVDLLTFVVDIGGKFNKFDKRYGEELANKLSIQNQQKTSKNKKQTDDPSIRSMKLDGVYIMDIIWKFR